VGVEKLCDRNRSLCWWAGLPGSFSGFLGGDNQRCCWLAEEAPGPLPQPTYKTCSSYRLETEEENSTVYVRAGEAVLLAYYFNTHEIYHHLPTGRGFNGSWSDMETFS